MDFEGHEVDFERHEVDFEGNEVDFEGHEVDFNENLNDVRIDRCGQKAPGIQQLTCLTWLYGPLSNISY
ncbi:hypothetical protein HAZT_HAZT001785 [Hyalella azteca]|uniref:Uncharacterized protein n=1 Tax=Hyalella azteca TaxID=294128 RepID=A0A6A0GVZ5_HYAAZ|nr:hypothetical protein HAZT_HAZT001785 [Hyalella azteca]